MFKFNTIEIFPKFHNREDWITFLDWSGISVLIILAISLPISSITSTRDICLGIVLFLWVIRSALTKNWRPRQTELDKAWIIYGVFVVLSLLTAVDLAYSLNQFRGEYVKNLLLFFLVVQFVDTEKRAKAILFGILAGNFIMIEAGIFDFLIKEGSLTSRVPEAPSGWGSLHGGGGAYSTYLITVLPFLLWLTVFWKKWWVLLLTFLLVGANVFSIYITFQRGAWVAFVATILVVPILSPIHLRLKMLSFLMILVAVGTAALLAPRIVIMRGLNIPSFCQISKEPEKYFPRLEIWRFSMKNFYSNPVKGAGIGRASLRKKYPCYRRVKIYWHAHNIYLNIALQLGLQGLIAFLYLWVRLFKIGLNGYKECKPGTLSRYLAGSLLLMVIAVSCKGMFDDFFVDDTALLFWLLSGLVVAVIQREIFLPQKRCRMGEQMR